MGMKTLKIPLGTTGFFAAAAILALSQTVWAQIPPAPATDTERTRAGIVAAAGSFVQWQRGVGAGNRPLSLSLSDAIQRGLKYDLGVLSNRDIVDISAADAGGL